MKTTEHILSEHLFFHNLAPRHLRLVAGCASNTRFDPGEYICREGDAAHRFYLIRHGKVAVETHSPARGSITIQTLGPGEVLGWSWLVPPHHWRFDARAVELTRMIALNGRCLRAKCEQDHDLGYEFLKRFAHIVARRLEATRFQLLDVYGAHT